MGDLLQRLWRPRLAERRVVLLCRNPDVARIVVAQSAEREISCMWISSDEWQRDRHAFYIVFVPNREAALWEPLLRREFYGAGNYILNWF